MRAILISSLATALVLVAAACGSTGAGGNASSNPSDAVMLATFQEGYAAVSSSDPLVAKLAHALNRLTPVCKERRHRLAAEIWASWKDLHKNHVNESILSVLTHVRESIPSVMGRTNCAQIMAAYLVLREG